MGTHRKSQSAKRHRTLTVGAVAIGFGALAAITAPAAQADWFGLLNGPLGGNGSGNATLTEQRQRQRQQQLHRQQPVLRRSAR